MAKTYTFYERNQENPDGVEVAHVVFDNGKSVWSGDPEIKTFAAEEYKFSTGEPFDDTNAEHMEMLPHLYHGSYFWVAEKDT